MLYFLVVGFFLFSWFPVSSQIKTKRQPKKERKDSKDNCHAVLAPSNNLHPSHNAANERMVRTCACSWHGTKASITDWRPLITPIAIVIVAVVMVVFAPNGGCCHLGEHSSGGLFERHSGGSVLGYSLKHNINLLLTKEGEVRHVKATTLPQRRCTL